MGCRVPAIPPGLAPGAVGESQIWCLELLPPHLPSLTSVSKELFVSHFFTPLSWLLLHSSFFPLLYLLSQVLAWLLRGLVLASPGLSWSWLALPLLDTGETSASFSQKHPCSPHYQTLAMQTQYTNTKVLSVKNDLYFGPKSSKSLSCA